MNHDHAAATVGALVWAHRGLFEVLGGWVPSTAEAAAKVHLATSSRRHAALATSWSAELPVLREVDPETLCAPAGPAAAAALDALAAVEGTVPRLAAVHRVVGPALVLAADRVGRAAGEVAGAGLRRVARLAVVDGTDAWLEGLDVLEGLRPDRAAREAAAAAVAAVDGALTGGGFLP